MNSFREGQIANLLKTSEMLMDKKIYPEQDDVLTQNT